MSKENINKEVLKFLKEFKDYTEGHIVIKLEVDDDYDINNYNSELTYNVIESDFIMDDFKKILNNIDDNNFNYLKKKISKMDKINTPFFKRYINILNSEYRKLKLQKLNNTK